jgi:hypothetical protein
MPLLDPLTIEYPSAGLHFIGKKSPLGGCVIKMPDYFAARQLQMVALDIFPEVLGHPITALTERLRPGCRHLSHAAVGLLGVF